MLTEEQARCARAAFGSGRANAPRAAVACAATRAGCAFTVDDLLRMVRADDAGIATATVYRAVAAMAARGYVERVGERDGAALYARCGTTRHHHHLVCTRCGAVADLPCPLDEAALDAAAGGFVVTGHEVNVFGLCPACAPEGTTRTGA